VERGTALVTSDVSWDDLTDIVCRRALGCEWGGAIAADVSMNAT
jgi:hypothetical protein